MGVEIERKFLVVDDSWRAAAARSVPCAQGYLQADGRRTVRVRLMGEKGFLTIKGATSGISRLEFEYEVPVAEAMQMLTLCAGVVEKTRHYIEHAGMTWELDVFEGQNAGLVMAEVELESEAQSFALPGWAGAEVSGDKRYYNAYLSRHPFESWAAEGRV